MKIYKSFTCLFFIFSLLKLAAQPNRPLLRIETGVHTGSIWRIASDNKGKYTITASEDRTIRIWNSDNGALLNTIRPFYVAGNQGKFFALDVTPNGQLIAAGGKMSADEDAKDWIYLFDLKTGEVARKITGVPGRVFHLKFSRDGKFLVAGLERGLGVVIYETSSGKIVATDAAYEGDIYSAEFDNQGHQLVTASLDGHLRLYNFSYPKLTLTDKKPEGDQPYSVSFSPAGNRLVAGFLTKPKVVVYNLAGGKFANERALDVRRIGTETGNHLGIVSFSTNGTYIYASGNARNPDDFQVIRKWEAATGRFVEDVLTPNFATVLQLAPAVNNKVLFATAAPDWGVIEPNGRISLVTPVGITDFSGQASTMAISENGMDVKLRLRKDSFEESIFSLNRFIIHKPTKTDTAYRLPSQPKEVISNWENSSGLLLSGKPLQLEANETSYSAAVNTAKSEIVIGTDRFIRCYNSQSQLLWRKPSPEVVWSVNITKNNKMIVALLGDGTVRWYNISNGDEILAAFIHPDQKRWIAWTSAGYYACSIGGEDFVGWQLNRTAEKASRFFPISKFRKEYYRPDMIKQVLLSEAAIQRPQPNISDQIEKKLPPIVTVLGPEVNSEITTKLLTISYKVESESPIINTKVLVNGRPAAIQRGLKPVKDVLTLQIPLSALDTTISILVENQHGFSTPATLPIKNKISVAPEEKSKLPSLYVLGIGISGYQQAELRLDFAAKDATDFTRLLLKQKGKLYGNVEVKLITEKDATKSQILEGLKWLQNQTKAEDTAILFMAGHGFNDEKEEFYYVPVEADPNRLVQTGLYFEDILSNINSIRGKVLFFVDACHSGNIMGKGRRQADVVRLANISASPENGIIVFTSSTGAQSSYEDPKWGNGAFTKAAVEGMNGKADLFNKATVTVKGLDAYISNRVFELTSGVQQPTTIIPMSIPDFQLLLLK